MLGFAWQTRDEGAPIESDLTAVVNRKWLIANGRRPEVFIGVRDVVTGVGCAGDCSLFTIDGFRIPQVK